MTRALFAALAVSVLAGAGAAQVTLEDHWSKAIGFHLAPLEHLQPLDMMSRKQAAKRTSATYKELAKAEYYRTSMKHPGDEKQTIKLTLCRFPLPQGVEGAKSVLVACDYTGGIVGAAVLDAKEQALEKWSNFTSQLVNRNVRTAARVGGPTELEAILVKARKGEDARSRFIGALVEQRRLMREHWPVTGKIMRVEDLSEVKPESIKRVRDSFAELVKLKLPLESWLRDSGKDYEKLARESVELVDAIGKAITEKRHDEARTLMQDYGKRCSACHNLKGAGAGDLRTAAIQRRNKLGVGEGYYVVGHDMILLEGEHEELGDGPAQLVATTLRNAVLCLDRMPKK